MSAIKNLDLFSVGIAVAAIVILGFSTFFSNRRSSTNKTFVLLAIFAATWISLNYLAGIPQKPEVFIWILRSAVFSAVWFAFYVFRLCYVFPKEKTDFPKIYKFILIPIVVLTSLLTLTPLVFKDIASFSPDGVVSEVNNGPGIVIFGLVVLFLNSVGVVTLFRKLARSSGTEKKQLTFMLTGFLIMLLFIVVFNFIFPAFLDIAETVKLGGLFIFPFILLTSYAIFRYRFLNIKVISTEILTFFLAVVTLFEVIVAKDPGILIFRAGIFASVLYFGILIIKSVLKEVEQREQLQELSEKLQKANTELESLSRFKSQMLALSAHQIKAPLATIKGFASIIMDGIYGPISDKIKETLQKMKNSADELITLINTLLDLRKVEEGKMDYKFETVKIKDLVQSVMDGLNVQADAKKLEFSFTSGSEANVSADPQKLKQVLQNLAENAIKYTPQGFVKVETKEDDGYVIFSVIDSGLGIGPNLAPHLFDQEFVRDERVKKEIKGTGLGLYIAKRIVTDHAGTIWAESDGEGKGSKFFVKLRKV